MVNHPPGSEQLIAYFEGKITDASTRAAIDAFIAADTAPLLVQDCMQAAWDNTRDAAIQPATAADWDKFRVIAGIHVTRKGVVRPMFAAAATLLLLVSFAAMYFVFQQRKTAPAIVWRQVSAGPGELRKVHLSDGSNLTIFPGSTIRYNNQYNAQVREIHLQGRAYFDVAAVAGKPFSVITGQYTTQVLGTAFEIAEQPQKQALAVVLVTGKVRLLNAQQQPLSELQPDQQITIHTDNAQYNILPVAAKSMVSWTTGRLTYDQTALADVCRELEKWYGVNITLQRATLGQKRITADFEHMTLSAVMHILSETAGFSWREVNNNIEVY
jgi:transmembrane sensor